MKAAVHDRYGPPETVAIRDVPRPEIKEHGVLVAVHATTVTTADWRFRASAFPGFFWLPGRLMAGLFSPRHRVLGGEFSGLVAAVGSKVGRFSPGDAVFGFAVHGAHAEFLAIAEDVAIAAKPANLDHGEAAAVPFGALSALAFLRDFAKVQAGQSVVVIGASGGVGVYAVQLARHFGAEVTGVCSTDNLDLVRSLGAARAIDYTKEDFTAGKARYDLVFDTVGKTTFAKAKQVLKPSGIFLPLEFGLTEIVQALATARGRGRKVLIGVSGDKQGDLEFVAGLLESGAIRPVIDRRLPLSQIVEAHRVAESRHKRGSVVVTVTPAEPGGGAIE